MNAELRAEIKAVIKFYDDRGSDWTAHVAFLLFKAGWIVRGGWR